MNKAVVQICVLCWLLLLRLTMHSTNIKLYTMIYLKILQKAGVLYHYSYEILNLMQ
jgi:hypothetical protein